MSDEMLIMLKFWNEIFPQSTYAMCYQVENAKCYQVEKSKVLSSRKMQSIIR